MSEIKEIKSEIKLANIKSIYIAKRITSFIKEVYNRMIDNVNFINFNKNED